MGIKKIKEKIRHRAAVRKSRKAAKKRGREFEIDFNSIDELVKEFFEEVKELRKKLS